jgi:hypothetical protein
MSDLEIANRDRNRRFAGDTASMSFHEAKPCFMEVIRFYSPIADKEGIVRRGARRGD